MVNPKAATDPTRRDSHTSFSCWVDQPAWNYKQEINILRISQYKKMNETKILLCMVQAFWSLQATWLWSSLSWSLLRFLKPSSHCKTDLPVKMKTESDPRTSRLIPPSFINNLPISVIHVPMVQQSEVPQEVWVKVHQTKSVKTCNSCAVCTGQHMFAFTDWATELTKQLSEEYSSLIISRAADIIT